MTDRLVAAGAGNRVSCGTRNNYIGSEDKMMWNIDPVDLWAALALVVGYSLPFVALLIEFKLQDLKEKAEQKEAQKAALRRLHTGFVSGRGR